MAEISSVFLYVWPPISSTFFSSIVLTSISYDLLFSNKLLFCPFLQSCDSYPLCPISSIRWFPLVFCSCSQTNCLQSFFFFLLSVSFSVVFKFPHICGNQSLSPFYLVISIPSPPLFSIRLPPLLLHLFA